MPTRISASVSDGHTCEIIYKYKEKIVILQSLGIIVTKSKETSTENAYLLLGTSLL